MKFLRALIAPLRNYAHWLHLRWPAGVPEGLPEVGPDGVTAIPGVRIPGDLLGAPLLKFAADSGARAVRAFIVEHALEKRYRRVDVLDHSAFGIPVNYSVVVDYFLARIHGLGLYYFSGRTWCRFFSSPGRAPAHLRFSRFRIFAN